MAIDWNNLISGNFIKLENGVPKKLVLTEWQEQTKFKDDKTDELRPGVTFKVTEEDDKSCEKEWTTTSMRCLALLKPIIEKAEAAQEKQVKVTVVRVGEAKATTYSVTRL